MSEKIIRVVSASNHPAYAGIRHTLVVDRETETAWFGRPVDNPACPTVEWPKLAWKEVPAAEDVLRRLVDTVETTGGVARDKKGWYYPIADEEWIDLGEVYVLACRLLGKEPVLTNNNQGPPWICDDCGGVNDEQDMVEETGVIGLTCPDCGSGHVHLYEEGEDDTKA